MALTLGKKGKALGFGDYLTTGVRSLFTPALHTSTSMLRPCSCDCRERREGGEVTSHWKHVTPTGACCMSRTVPRTVQPLRVKVM